MLSEFSGQCSCRDQATSEGGPSPTSAAVAAELEGKSKAMSVSALKKYREAKEAESKAEVSPTSRDRAASFGRDRAASFGRDRASSSGPPPPMVDLFK